MSTLKSLIAIISLFIIFIFGVKTCNYVGKMSSVVEQQTDPAILLKRYEWFKNTAAQLDKKKADITIYESRFDSLKQLYAGSSRLEWSREDREQANLWTLEVSGIQASYNGLAAEYNAAMSKINYAFTNVGDLPQGASQPLPREFATYISK